MKKLTLKQSLLASAATTALSMVPAAKAAPFIDLEVLGSTDNVNFSSTINVTPGETVYYQVLGNVAPSGTSNTHQTSPLGNQIAGTDGLNSITLNITNTDPTVTGITAALFDGWSSGSGANAGTASGGSVRNVAAAQSPGVEVGATAPFEIFYGSFVSGAGNSDVAASVFSPTPGSGSAKVILMAGTQKTIIINDTTESSSDPYVGSGALHVAETSAMPAPGVVPAVGALVSSLGIIGLVRRRRSI